MHSKSQNIEIIINEEADEVIEEHFKSLRNRFQNNLESMKGSEFVFDYVHFLYYKYVDDEIYCKVRDNCHYTEEYKGAADSLYNLKDSGPKIIMIITLSEFAEEFEKQVICLQENTEKLQQFIKLKNKLRKIYLTYYSLLIVQGLW